MAKFHFSTRNIFNSLEKKKNPQNKRCQKEVKNKIYLQIILTINYYL